MKKLINKKVFGIFIYLSIAVSFIFMIVVSFAWLPDTIRQTKVLKYENDMIISSLDIDVWFYVYDEDYTTPGLEYVLLASLVTDEDTGQKVLTQTSNGISLLINPGDRLSYKFVIKNNSATTALVADLTLEDFDIVCPKLEDDETDRNLYDYLAIYISTPEAYDIPQLSGRDHGKNYGVVTNYQGQINLPFYNDLTIEEGETIDVNWYIELKGTTPNQFQGAKISFKDILLSI